MAFSQPVSSVSINVPATTSDMQLSSMETSSTVTSSMAPAFHSGIEPTTTAAPRYTGTGRPTYNRIVTSDGRVRRSKQDAPLPPRRQMRFTASRMCCPGDENLVRVKHDDTKSDEEWEATTSTSNNSANINTVQTVEPSSPSTSGTMTLRSQDTTSPLKHPVQ